MAAQRHVTNVARSATLYYTVLQMVTAARRQLQCHQQTLRHHVLRVQLPQPSSLLSTAYVSAIHKDLRMTSRALVDPVATISLITSRMVHALGLPKIPHHLEVVGLEGEETSRYCVDLQLCSAHLESDPEDHINVHCHVVDKLFPIIPCDEAKNVRSLPILLDKIPLADPDLGTPVRIDILLGIADVNRAFRDEIHQTPDRSIQVSRTVFSWTVGGELKPSSSRAIVMRVAGKPATNQLLEHLWEREETPKQRAVTTYKDTYQRLPDGRYSVCLPRIEPTPELGDSRPLALKCFLSNERSLQRRGQLSSYASALKEYGSLGHSEKVPDQDLAISASQHFYMPAHGVVKEASTTTKLRVVFDASAKTPTGVSLNDTLLPIPSLYPLLTSVLNKFRLHKVALTSDISKMFQEVVLDPQEWDYHQFLRRSEDGTIEDHRMRRLTFGISVSPYLATQVLQQVASDHSELYPEAARIVKSSFYVDDCLTGASTPEQAIHL